jgi:hypothetical protein
LALAGKKHRLVAVGMGEGAPGGYAREAMKIPPKFLLARKKMA